MTTDHLAPFFDADGVTLYHGEALRVLRALPDASADAVITDPPYSSGGLHRSDRNRSTGHKYVQTGTQTQRPDFEGDHRDQRSYLAWCALWIHECARILKPGRPALIFTDWRQLPITTDAIQAGGFVWRGIVAWDKGRGVRPNLGFSAQAEYVVWGTRGPINLGHEVYLDGVLQARVRPDDKHHQTGKPVGLLEQLIQITPQGGGRHRGSVHRIGHDGCRRVAARPARHRLRSQRGVPVDRTRPPLAGVTARRGGGLS